MFLSSHQNFYDEIKIKGSIFKIFSYKATNLSDIKNKLKQLEEKYSDASHICYAYRLCDIGNLDLFLNPAVVDFSTDSGEPSGTAGKPILNVLKRNNIINRVIFVIRYFGGTKLGIPGLIDAYKKSAELVSDNSDFYEWILCKNITLKLNYSLYDIIKDIIFKYNGKIIENKFIDEIELNVDIPYKNIDKFKKKIINKSKGTIIILD